jgi:signal transduction histidine kinase
MIGMNPTEATTQTMPTIEQGAERGLLGAIGARAKRTALDVVYLLAVFAMSIVGFTVWVTGLSLTVSLLILIVGVLVWIGTVYAFRWTTWVDRKLAGWARGEPIEATYQRPRGPGFIEFLRALTVDPQTWKDLGWLVLNSVAGFVLSLAALTLSAVVLSYVLMPAWWWAIPDPSNQYGTLEMGVFQVTSFGWAFVLAGVGLLLAPLAIALDRGLVRLHTATAARVLGPSESQRLRARVDDLAASRAGAVEVAQDQLERIERDLHDGAQARLVALALELGMAEEELEADPDAARETVRRARGEALSALEELRDLSRGMRPALLEERGLLAAVEALAGRSPLPTTITALGSLEELPEPVQSGAYFVVAEALTNAAKHAGAERATVALERAPAALAVTVSDDGRGGADPRGSGLDGLAKRVRALDGELRVSSPAGGPTVVSAEIPCG